MKNPREIYAAYKTMPNLQLHQLRVAAVGKLICDGFTKSINTRDVILACLFHDMGNILKFNYDAIPEALEPEGRAYWERVRSDLSSKYGTKVREATNVIVREIGLSEHITSLLDGVGFSQLKEILAEESYERKIIEYADCRVSPYGIVSVRERFAEGRTRYQDRYASSKELNAHYDDFAKAGYAIEQQIFENATIKPEDINDATVAPFIEELWEYPVS